VNPVRAALRYPQVTLVLSGMLFVVGLYSLVTMPRREDPKITIHTGVVAAIYPGATTQEVENQVTRKIEEHLFRFAEVRREKTFSTTRNGMVIVNVDLNKQVKDSDEFWSKLRLDMAQLKATELPAGVRGPIVDSDFGDTAAAIIAVHGGHYGYRELKDYAQTVEAGLRTIPAISKIKRIGDQTEEIDISTSTERLAQYSVNPLKVMLALQGRNTTQYAGRVATEQSKVPIESGGRLQTEGEIRQVIVDVSPTGQPVYIGDLASVDRVYKDPAEYARIDGDQTILLVVEMHEGNNIVDFGDTLRARLQSIQSSLPPDVKLDMVADQPRVVSERIRDFFREFGIAIVAVILVTLLLLPLRVALVSAIAIPVSVSMTFGMLNACGIELQQVSISALIVVLGMVVDNAIVIVDNYVELLDRRVPTDEAAERCATEMAVPVLTATLAIIAAFAPLLLLSGAVGEFIRSLPIAVAGRHGRGRYVLFGGPHAFETGASGLLHHSRNTRFLEKVFQWLLSEAPLQEGGAAGSLEGEQERLKRTADQNWRRFCQVRDEGDAESRLEMRNMRPRGEDRWRAMCSSPRHIYARSPACRGLISNWCFRRPGATATRSPFPWAMASPSAS